MHSALSPNSPHARLIADLWWWMVGVGGAIWILVSVAAVYAAFARHGQPGADGVMNVAKETHQRIERVVQAAVGVTILILLGFLVASFGVGRALAQHPTDRALTIEVSGRQWWWQFDYQHPDPSKRVTTANEVRSTPTATELTLGLGLRVVRALVGQQPTVRFRQHHGSRYHASCLSFPSATPVPTRPAQPPVKSLNSIGAGI